MSTTPLDVAARHAFPPTLSGVYLLYHFSLIFRFTCLFRMMIGLHCFLGWLQHYFPRRGVSDRRGRRRVTRAGMR